MSKEREYLEKLVKEGVTKMTPEQMEESENLRREDGNHTERFIREGQAFLYRLRNS